MTLCDGSSATAGGTYTGSGGNDSDILWEGDPSGITVKADAPYKNLGDLVSAIKAHPAGKMKADAREEVKFKPVGVTDVTLGSIDLEKQPAHLKDRELRFRKLTIEPGGIVPWHSHDDRPALIFVQQGEIVEYASNCAEPILHKAGDIRPEVFGTSHWWKNLGTQTVILYVGDVRKDPHDHNM